MLFLFAKNKKSTKKTRNINMIELGFCTLKKHLSTDCQQAVAHPNKEGFPWSDAVDNTADRPGQLGQKKICNRPEICRQMMHRLPRNDLF